MNREIKDLYRLGFAIHWLKPKSKMPINRGWTTGPRAEWSDLRESYRKGLNVGVRLGKASRIGKRYLCVVDCDIKSDAPRHRAEMEKKLDQLFPGLRSKAPMVLTGRGNGSMHLYGCIESIERGRRVGQSSETVKVKVPSAEKVSRRDRDALTDEEIEAGYRMRPAWEISFMCEGGQVVLPPSIHPDTKRRYQWARALNGAESLPLISVPETKAERKEESAAPDLSGFKPVEVDLIGSELSGRTVDMILTGKGVVDRSGALMTAALDMVKCGFSDHQILSVLTDRENFLGEVAYDHAKTNKRVRAARWLARYTIPKARKEADARHAFGGDDEELPELSDEAAAKQASDLVPWTTRLDKTRDGDTRSTLKNLDLILTNAVSPHVFRRNLFSGRDVYGVNTPWGGEKGKELTDDDAIKIKRWLADEWGIEPVVNLVFEAMTAISIRAGFHPVRDYLKSLEWDGVPRVDSWLKTYMGATGPEPYLSEVSRKVLCAMIARVFEPGVKFDHMVVLEGKQGTGKSSAARILAGEEWYCDTLPDIKDKDAMLNLQGAWIVEVGELATLKRADAETYKSFITRQTDRVRAPYGRKWAEYPRQCIFIGTTNADDYLRDKTGNRRFWPVLTKQCQFEALARDRDQLLAEAMFLYRDLGEPLFLEGEAKVQAEDMQASRAPEDEESAMRERVLDWIEAENRKPRGERFPFGKGFTLTKLFEGPDTPFEQYKPDNMHLQMAARALKAAGFHQYRASGRMKYKLNE